MSKVLDTLRSKMTLQDKLNFLFEMKDTTAVKELVKTITLQDLASGTSVSLSPQDMSALVNSISSALEKKNAKKKKKSPEKKSPEKKSPATPPPVSIPGWDDEEPEEEYKPPPLPSILELATKALAVIAPSIFEPPSDSKPSPLASPMSEENQEKKDAAEKAKATVKAVTQPDA